MIDERNDFQRVDGKLDRNGSLEFSSPFAIIEFFRSLGDDGISVVVQPVQEWLHRGKFRVFGHSGV
jgi:hypothetical protein